MAIVLGIIFSVVVVLYPLVCHLIPAVLLCVFGFFTNVAQAICFICIRPISENAYTRLNGVVKELDWRFLLGLVKWWAGVLILECMEQKNTHLNGEEHEVVVSNARDDPDRLLELVIDQWSGCLGSLLAVIKTSARYGLSNLEDFPQPFWLSVVLERAGFTQGDLLAAQRLPVPSKILSSETKNLVYAVRRAYGAVPAVYVITVAIPKTSSALSLGNAIKAPPAVYVYVRRHATKKWPEIDGAVEKWCTEILAAKDALLNERIAEKTFGHKGFLAIGRPVKCFLVEDVISLILLWWAMKFNFVCCTTLLVFGAALFTGRVLALFGCGVLSMLQCFMRSAIANITWSEHLQPICDPICHLLLEVVADYSMTFPWDKW